MIIPDGTTILFTGDSITDCGRARPVGEGDGLGRGYVSFLDSLLAVGHPERRLRLLNTGISGNRVTNLERRWQTDVLDLAPDWLSVLIGINDVWKQFGDKFDPDPVPLDRYETTYRGLLARTRPRLKGLVLQTPYVIEPDRRDPMRELMDAYGAVVKKLAGEFDAVLVDVQAAFDRYLEHRPGKTLCDDRVHPNQAGHLLIARAFLAAVGA